MKIKTNCKIYVSNNETKIVAEITEPIDISNVENIEKAETTTHTYRVLTKTTDPNKETNNVLFTSKFEIPTYIRTDNDLCRIDINELNRYEGAVIMEFTLKCIESKTAKKHYLKLYPKAILVPEDYKTKVREWFNADDIFD